MKGLNLSSFKKLRTEKDHTVMKHKDGHELKIAHKNLSKDLKKQLDTLPHYQEGGEVKDRGTAGQRERTRVDAARASIPGSYVESNQGDRQLIDRYADGGEVYPACKNPNCKSHGRAHPNCRCHGGYADGGEVSNLKENYCSSPKMHNRDCEYFAEGGPVTVNKDKAKEVSDSFRKVFYEGGDGKSLSPEQFDQHLADLKSQGYKVGSESMEPQPVQASKLESQYGAEDTKASPAPQQPNIAELSAQAVQSQAQLAQSQAQITQALTAAGQQQQSPQQAPQPQAPVQEPKVPGAGNLVGSMQSNLKGQASAEQRMAENSQQAQSAVANVHGNEAQQLQQMHQYYEKTGHHIVNQIQDLSDQVSKGQIDPNHFFNSKSTGGKILTAIGMLFSGAGMGAAGKPELATKYIDDAIDRDIDSQKANLQNKNNLLSKYMDLYKSLPEAEAATRLTLHATTEGLINQQAAKLNSANALDAARAAAFERNQKVIPHIQELAKGQMLLNMLKDNGGVDSSSEQGYKHKLDAYKVIMPDRYKQEVDLYLPGVGVASTPISEKVRGDISARKELSTKLAVLENFAKENQGSWSPATIQRGKVLAGEAQNAYRTGTHQGVFKEGDQKFIESIVPSDPTKYLASQRTLPAYRELRDSNNRAMQILIKSYGVTPFKGAQGSSPSNEAAMKWLKANPNDPRAAAVRQKLGK